MKKAILFIFFLSIIFSCNENYERPLNTIKTKTIIKGNVSDLQRGIPIDNFKIVFKRYWDGWSVFQYALKSELIDSVRTDSNGNYKIVFEFIKDERYGFEKQYYGSPYYTDFIDGSKIIPGQENTQDIDAWYPTILKIKVKVLNNNNPPVRISNSVINSKGGSIGPNVSFYKKELDTIVYLKSKPNSAIKLNTVYSTGYSNADFHGFETLIRTSLLDTINLTHSIDCNTF